MTLSVLEAVDYYKADKNDISGNHKLVLASTACFTKTNSPRSSHPATPRAMFTLASVVEDKRSLGAYFTEVIQPMLSNDKQFFIRGKYKTNTVGDVVERRSDLVDFVPSRFIAIDIDEMPLDGMEGTDLETQGTRIVSMLNAVDPKVFPLNMGYIIQASSSAGMRDKVKVHMYFLNHYEVNQSQLKQYFFDFNFNFRTTTLAEYSFVDLALFSAVQPHYTASPHFDGVLDPFIGRPRAVLVKGSRTLIPDVTPEFVKAVVLSDTQRASFLDSVEGKDYITPSLDSKIQICKSWKDNADIKKSTFRNSVISAYHTAWQDCVDMKLMDKEMRPIVARLRPNDVDDYIAQGRKAALNNFVALSQREIPMEHLGYQLSPIKTGTGKYVNFEQLPPENSITFLKASLGTGKTTAIEKWLREGQICGRFVSITDTSALVESNAVRFGAGDYRVKADRDAFNANQITRMSGTLHSLWRLKGKGFGSEPNGLEYKFDFVFIDEADSVMNTLLFNTTIPRENLDLLTDTLRDVLHNAKRVILSDGDLSEETVQAYLSLMGGTMKSIHRVNHATPTLKGVTAYHHITESSLWGALQASLSTGEKCIVVTDTSPDKLNEKVGILTEYHPSLGIKAVHANSTKDPDIREIVNNTNTALKEQDISCLLCSPSITNGVDFKYFDTVFVVTASENHTPNMRYQALRREREPREIHYFFNNIKGYSTGYRNVRADQDWTTSCRRLYAIRRENESKNYVNTFMYYLLKEGARIEVVNDPWEPLEDINGAIEKYKYERIMAILNSSEFFQPLRHADAFEQKKIAKVMCEVDELSVDNVEWFLEEKPYEKAAFLHKVFGLLWNDILKCDADAWPLTKALHEKGAEYYLLTGRQARLSKNKDAAGKQILRQCGIKKPGEFQNAITWYKHFCFIEGIEVPECLRNKNDEEIIDL